MAIKGNKKHTKKRKQTINAKLTPKQEKFANLYVELGNASEAYRGSYVCARMKPETIHVRASKLLKEYKVSTRVAELQEEAQKRSDITKDEAIKELANIVRVNPLDYVKVEQSDTITFDDDGEMSTTEGQKIIVKDLSQLTAEQQRCIKSISPVRGGIKIEFEGKIQAIDRLSKMLGWDEPSKRELTGKDGKDLIPDTDLSKLSTDELKKYHELLSKATNKAE